MSIKTTAVMGGTDNNQPKAAATVTETASERRWQRDRGNDDGDIEDNRNSNGDCDNNGNNDSGNDNDSNNDGDNDDNDDSDNDNDGNNDGDNDDNNDEDDLLKLSKSKMIPKKRKNMMAAKNGMIQNMVQRPVLLLPTAVRHKKIKQ